MIARHHIFAVVALFTSGLVAGCGERRDPGSFRLITAASHGVLNFETTQHVVFRWEFLTAGDLEAWTLENVDGEVEATGQGLAMFTSSDDPFLWRRTILEAESVDSIRVHLGAATGVPAAGEPGARDPMGPPPGPSDLAMVQLFWAAADEDFSETRQMALAEPTLELEDGVSVYQFPVGLDPSWSGEIDRLRLDPTSLPRMRVLLGRIEGIREEVPDPSLPRTVELGSERRLALLVPPDSPLELEVDVPPAAVLRFGYGLLGGAPSGGQRSRPGGRSAELRVSVSPAERRRATQMQAAARTLFTAAFSTAGEPSTRDWMEARIRLDGFAGQRLSLRFESAVRAGTGGLPVVSNPELYSTRPSRLPPNVLLICVDTLRADHLSLYGYRKVTSPAIDAWARDRGVVFKSTVAPSPWTLPSHVSMLTGLDALKHGVNYPSSAMSPDLPTLTGLLRRAGYRTAAVTGGGFLAPGYGFERDFDRFRWWPEQTGGASELESHGQRALEWIDELSDRPFFLFFHTYEVHSPYYRREPFFSAFGGREEELVAEPLSALPGKRHEEEGFQHRHRLAWANGDGSPPAQDVDSSTLAALYDSGIAHVDAVIGRLLEHLRLLDLEADTIVVLTSDHGESLGEHGLLGHGNLYDDNLLVPLVISYPRRLPAAKLVRQQVRSVDLLPTILALAGVEAPPGLDGTSLLPLMEAAGVEAAGGEVAGGEVAGVEAQTPAWSYGGWPNYGLAVRQDNVKYIFNDAPWPAICGDEELYEMDRDPAQSDNRAGSSRDASVLRLRAQGYLRRNASGLILQLANREAEPLYLTFEGPEFLPWTLKWLECTCPELSLQDARRIRVTVLPGRMTTLVWQQAQAQRLEITAQVGQSAGPERQKSVTLSDPQELRDPRILRYVDPQWQWTRGRAEGTWTGVRVWWSEPRGVEPRNAPPDGFRQQLEALGYLR